MARRRLAWLAPVLVFGAGAAQDPTDPPGAPGMGAGAPAAASCRRIGFCSSPGVMNGAARNPKGQIWQTDFDGKRLRLMDPARGCGVLRTCAAPGGRSPSENAYLDGVLYHYDFGTGRIYAIDPVTCRVLASCDAPGDDRAEGLTSDGTHLWKGDSKNLYRFTPPPACRVVRTVPNPPGDAADGLAFCGSRLLMLGYSGTLYQLDPVTGAVLASCTLAQGAEGNGITADARRLFVDRRNATDVVDLDCSVLFGRPTFGATTPCGELRLVAAGTTISFDVTARANHLARLRSVVLTASALPPGARTTPPLPIRGQPARTRFSWTPSRAQLGTHAVTFAARDDLGRTTTCTVRVRVRGCRGPASFIHYGKGLPGTMGEPSLTVTAPPTLCTTIGFRLTNSARRATSACLLFGLARANQPTIFGGTMLVDRNHPSAVVRPLALPAAGATVSERVPCVAGPNCGLSVYVQGFVLDPGARAGVAFTRGLQLLLGD